MRKAGAHRLFLWRNTWRTRWRVCVHFCLRHLQYQLPCHLCHWQRSPRLPVSRSSRSKFGTGRSNLKHSAHSPRTLQVGGSATTEPSCSAADQRGCRPFNPRPCCHQRAEGVATEFLHWQWAQVGHRGRSLAPPPFKNTGQDMCRRVAAPAAATCTTVCATACFSRSASGASWRARGSRAPTRDAEPLPAPYQKRWWGEGR